MYYKQTQLEAMASKKAAAEFQLEKEMKRLQEAQVEAEMSRVSRRASSSWEEDTDMKTLDFAEWSKTSRFWGCQGHTISVAISNCSNPAAFLFEEQADSFPLEKLPNLWDSATILYNER
ncbi:unnamed protein product [Camellia sinensis]